jgi:hypothetical protein
MAMSRMTAKTAAKMASSDSMEDRSRSLAVLCAILEFGVYQ